MSKKEEIILGSLKATGISRRIDGVGRLVIPIEIIRNNDISTSRPFEIFIKEDSIVLKYYSENANTDEITGVTRKLDTLGRLVIPMEIRRGLGLKAKTYVTFFLDEKNIIIKKLIGGCIFCGEQDNTIKHSEKEVCKPCINKMHIAANK